MVPVCARKLSGSTIPILSPSSLHPDTSEKSSVGFGPKRARIRYEFHSSRRPAYSFVSELLPSPSFLVQSPSQDRPGLLGHQADGRSAQAPYDLRGSPLSQPVGMLECPDGHISDSRGYLYETLPLLLGRNRSPRRRGHRGATARGRCRTGTRATARCHHLGQS